MSNLVNDVRVNLSERGYDIAIGVSNLGTIGQFIRDRIELSHALVVTDANVEKLYAGIVAKSLAEQDAEVDLLAVEPGEPSKSIEMADQLWNKFLELGADRSSVVIAVGGGVIGDLAGFIAATFARGLAFFQVPTSLLAQVDSSVGGKVGVNLPGAKNIVGAFWQPSGVLIDISVLNSLPTREYQAGLAEVVKYGVILDQEFFVYLEQNIEALNNRDVGILKYVVARCCRLKADVVEADEREETGIRAVLNYGHTFCHAIETVTGYGQLLHGEAVAIGMLCASRLAEKLGRIDTEVTKRQHDLLTALGLPVSVPDVSHDDLLSAMQRDKKVHHGTLRFVLPTRMGHVELVSDIDPQLVQSSLSCS